MRLCLIKPDGSNAEILLTEKQPSLETLNNELLLFENYSYKLIVRDNAAADNIELFVGDYPVQLTFNTITGCFETETGLFFNGCFDLTYLSIYMDDGEGEGKIFYTEFLRVATTKQTARQVEQMLVEIEGNIPNFLEVCFSRNWKKSGVIKNDIRSIWNTFTIVDEIIKVYEENYGFFSNHKKASVEPVSSIVDIRAMKTVDQDSLRWIVCNPDNLIQIERDTGIVLNNRNYMPSKIKTYISQYSYDVYENRVVLGFLQSVIDYVDSQIVGFRKEISELENIPNSIIVQLPNTHELTGRCVYIYYKGIIDRFSEEKTILQEIYYKYERALECTADIVHGIPRLTNTFKQVYHYRLCYECMVKWFELGDYSFDHLNYLFKLKTLSRIFEYFCLIKLQMAIVQCGYTIREAGRIEYDTDADIEDINNQYIFSGHGYELTLLYEPIIWVNKVSDGMNLYSTGYNFSRGKWNDRWAPDFVIKISGDYKAYYYVLDAKYSNIQNVNKRYIPELVLKYSTQIASKDQLYSDVIGVGAIYPGNKDKMDNFKKNAVSSKKISLPQYFSLSIVGEDAGTQALKTRVNELLKVVEEIESETEIEKSVNSQKAHSSFAVKNDIENEDKMRQMVGKHDEKEKTFSAGNTFNSNFNEKNAQFLTNSIIRVNGKRCFYYGKSICLCQKKMCTIIDAPCEFYISKSSKELLKTEDTCRNFTQRKRRGKIYSVECSVSGLFGCVGSDNCKFYLKKNKSKK